MAAHNYQGPSRRLIKGMMRHGRLHGMIHVLRAFQDVAVEAASQLGWPPPRMREVGSVFSEGNSWQWSHFSEYIDALSRTPRAIDVGTQVPHDALRVFAMGERAAARSASAVCLARWASRLAFSASALASSAAWMAAWAAAAAA